jgi:hypothetical protein
MDKDNADADEVHPDQVGERINSDPTLVYPQKLFHN